MHWWDVSLFVIVSAFWLIVAFLGYRWFWVWKAVRIIALVEAIELLADIEEQDIDKFWKNGGHYPDRIARYWPKWRMFWSMWIWDTRKMKN